MVLKYESIAKPERFSTFFHCHKTHPPFGTFYRPKWPICLAFHIFQHVNEIQDCSWLWYSLISHAAFSLHIDLARGVNDYYGWSENMQFVVTIVSCVVVILVVRIIALQWYGACVYVWRAIHPSFSSLGVLWYRGRLYRGLVPCIKL